MACNNLKRYDQKMMNYQFIKRYNNDSTRVLFMDFTLNKPYFDKNGINTVAIGLLLPFLNSRFSMNSCSTGLNGILIYFQETIIISTWAIKASNPTVLYGFPKNVPTE
jgi:hypothetical protein